MRYITSELYTVVQENEKMIYKLASNYSSNLKEDLYQVGVIGLISAYKNYDASYGTKFSTYAHPYILGEMKKYVRENKSVKISRDIIYLSSRLDRLTELLFQKYKRAPTTEELSLEVGVEEWKIIEALNARNAVKSLDDPLKSDGKEVTVMDITEDDRVKANNIELRELLDTLEKEEKSIIKMRYFLDKSQEEVALLLGYSQAKISRIEKRILNKLKNYYD
mgnify:CR=1 FL=1